MAEDTFDDFLDFWETISSTGLKVAEYQNAKANADANRELAVKLEEKKIQYQEQQDDLAFQKRVAFDIERDNEAKLKDAINELELWNINAETVTGMPTQYQTDDAKKILTEMGIQLNSDLTVAYDTRGNTRQLLQRMNKANEVQTAIISNLDGILGEVYDSQKYLDNVGIKEGLSLVKDIDDFNAYIASHPIDNEGNWIFPKDDPKTPLNEGYLANAFRSEKMINMSVDVQSKAAKLHNVLMAGQYDGGDSEKEAKKKIAKMEDELKSAQIKDLKTGLSALSTWETTHPWTDMETHEDYPLFLRKIGTEYKADKIDTAHGREELAMMLHGNITKIMKWGDDLGGNDLHQTFPLLNGLVHSPGYDVGEKIFNAYMMSEILLPQEVPDIRMTVEGNILEDTYEYY